MHIAIQIYSENGIAHSYHYGLHPPFNRKLCYTHCQHQYGDIKNKSSLWYYGRCDIALELISITDKLKNPNPSLPGIVQIKSVKRFFRVSVIVCCELSSLICSKKKFQSKNTQPTTVWKHFDFSLFYNS